MLRDYTGGGWEEVLQFNGLQDFEALWTLEAGWFEAPNQRRGGWSGVSRVLLKLPEGGETAVFLKRQENHTRKTLRHPVSGEPTFRGELNNILALRHADIPTLEPLYYAERKHDKGWQCILMTAELTGYRPLDSVMAGWHQQGWHNTKAERQALLKETAKVVARLHANHLVHRALYPKHLFVNVESNSVCIIDLEKMRRVLFRWRAGQRDLDSLNRHAPYWSRADRLRFLLSYLDQSGIKPEVRNLWTALSLRALNKR